MPVPACLHAAVAKNPSEKQWTEFGRLSMKLSEKKRAHMQREESEMVPVAPDNFSGSVGQCRLRSLRRGE